MSGSQEQQTASVSADSHEEAPKESQSWLGRDRGRRAVKGDEGEASGEAVPSVARLDGVKRGYVGVMSDSLSREINVLPQKK